MQNVSAPNLLRLRVRFPDVTHVSMWATLVDPIIRALQFPRLRLLEMNARHLPMSVTAPFLRAHPTLEVLVMYGFLLEEDFARALTSSAAEALLPNLRAMWVVTIDPAIASELLRLRASPFLLHSPYTQKLGEVARKTTVVVQGQNKLIGDVYTKAEVYDWYRDLILE